MDVGRNGAADATAELYVLSGGRGAWRDICDRAGLNIPPPCKGEAGYARDDTIVKQTDGNQ